MSRINPHVENSDDVIRGFANFSSLVRACEAVSLKVEHLKDDPAECAGSEKAALVLEQAPVVYYIQHDFARLRFT
jgi:hypothetical protein